MILDTALMPKPFQINAINDRDWKLVSDWKSFDFKPSAFNRRNSTSQPARNFLSWARCSRWSRCARCFCSRYWLLPRPIPSSLTATIHGGLAAALIVRLRQGRFGTRLLAKLAVFFTLVGVLPGSLIYLISLQFVARS